MNDVQTLMLRKEELSLFQTLDGAAQPRHCLIVYSGGRLGRRIDLTPGSWLIGRGADSPLKLDSPGLSRRHALIDIDGAQVLLRDLGSANGSYVNDQRVTEAQALRDGDLLRLGSVALKFHSHTSLDAQVHERIYRQAITDEGTGIYNRRYFRDTLSEAMTSARARAQPLALISADLDHFKSVNDRFGHPAGDQVLRQTAAAMQAAIRPPDVLGRVGGEEFAVLLLETGHRTALAVAERMRLAVQALALHLPLLSGGAPVLHRQTLSLGLVVLSQATPDEESLWAAVDQRLYAAKRGGRNTVAA